MDAKGKDDGEIKTHLLQPRITPTSQVHRVRIVVRLPRMRVAHPHPRLLDVWKHESTTEEGSEERELMDVVLSFRFLLSDESWDDLSPQHTKEISEV